MQSKERPKNGAIKLEEWDSVAPLLAGITNKTRREILVGPDGRELILFENGKRISLSEAGVPQLVDEHRAFSLSCGHVEDDPKKVRWCSYGHSLCSHEPLYNCNHATCRRLICDAEVVVWADMTFCPEHVPRIAPFVWFAGVGLVGLFLLLLSVCG